MRSIAKVQKPCCGNAKVGRVYFLLTYATNCKWTLNPFQYKDKYLTSSVHSDLTHSPSTFCQWLTDLYLLGGGGGNKSWERNPCIFLPLNISPITCTVLPFLCSQQKKGPYCVSGHPLTCDLNTSLPTSSNCPPPSALLHRFYHLQMSFNTSIKNSNNKTHRILSWSHSLPQIYYFSTPFLSKLF